MSKRTARIIGYIVSGIFSVACAYAFIQGNNPLGYYSLALSIVAPIVPEFME